MHLNFEFKARTANNSDLEQKLLLLHPRFVGEDHQIDTYFNTENGRLKLREGRIENALIFYKREDIQGAKQSDIQLFSCQKDSENILKNLLESSNGIKVVVDKRRRIYFVDNVKFHFDIVEGLGYFMEVEAIDENGTIGINKLQEQCHFYQKYFDISEDQMQSDSYSDLLLKL